MQVQTSKIAKVEPVGKLPSFGTGGFFLDVFSSKSHWISLSWYSTSETLDATFVVSCDTSEMSS